MTVKVKLFANLAEKAGGSEIQVSVEAVKEALIELERKYPSLEDKMFKDHDRKELSENITVIKDGRNISYLDGIETSLEEGDELSLFPPIGGG